MNSCSRTCRESSEAGVRRLSTDSSSVIALIHSVSLDSSLGSFPSVRSARDCCFSGCSQVRLVKRYSYIWFRTSRGSDESRRHNRQTSEDQDPGWDAETKIGQIEDCREQCTSRTNNGRKLSTEMELVSCACYQKTSHWEQSFP